MRCAAWKRLECAGVLEALLHKGPLPVNALGEKVLLTSGSITTAVDRLERVVLSNGAATSMTAGLAWST